MALANIVLVDTQATPVTHTFVPVGPDENGVLTWQDQSAASPLGYWSIKLDLKIPSLPQAGTVSQATQRVIRPRIELHMPVLENVTNSTVSGIAPAPTVSYVCRVRNGEFIIPERATLQNRKDLRKLYKDLLQDLTVSGMLENLVRPY